MKFLKDWWVFLRKNFWYQQVNDDVLREQLVLLQKGFPFALVGAAGGVLVSFFVSPHVPGVATAVATYVVYTLLGIWHVRGMRIESANARRNAVIITLWMAGLGTLIGIMGYLVVRHGEITSLTVFMVVGTGIVSGALGFSSSHFPVAMSFITPVVIGYWGSAFGRVEDEIRLMIQWGAPILWTAHTHFLAINYRSITRNIELRFSNHNLLLQLEVEIEQAELAKRRAIAADQAKSKFLAAASHDLRQPVHAIGLFLSVLDKQKLSQEQLDILSNVDSALQACREMLRVLLDFSRIEAGIVVAQAVEFDLQVLMHRIHLEFSEETAQKDLVLRLRDTSLKPFADPVLVEMALRNLVSNALRYTQRGGLLLGVRKRQHEAVIEVWDTGIGIAPEDQESVFAEFHQLGNPERDQSKGLGLGLTIVKGLCQAMEARVSLRSQLGRGSVFRLHLPLVKGAITVPPVTDKQSAAQALPNKPTFQTDAQIKGLRVLVIEDNTSALAAVVLVLRQIGVTCQTAEGIPEALACVENWVPDLILTDYRLRGTQTGGDAIRFLRAKLGVALPAIIITGDTEPERLKEARGIQALLLHKPLTAETLLSALLESKQAMTSETPRIANHLNFSLLNGTLLK